MAAISSQSVCLRIAFECHFGVIPHGILAGDVQAALKEILNVTFKRLSADVAQPELGDAKDESQSSRRYQFWNARRGLTPASLVNRKLCQLGF